MAKIILEDIKINKNRKLNLFEKEIISPVVKNLEKSDQFREKRLERNPQIKIHRNLISKNFLLVAILILFVFGFYSLGNYFYKATIHIIPKSEVIKYKDKSFTSLKSSNDGLINFEIMIVSDDIIKNVVLTEPEEVSIKAKGSITLYNEFSINPQKLSKGTFLSDENGKSYQINSEVVIPGYKVKGKENIAGSVTVEASSFLPGDIYNGSPSKFFINSFKGTTKYNKIYGRANTPFTGGVAGVVYKLDENNRNNILNESESLLKENLLKKAYSLVPPGYMLYPEIIDFAYKIDDSIISLVPETQIKINGTLGVVLLEKKSLINNIIKNSLTNISKEELKEINILDLEKLSFRFVDAKQTLNKDTDSLSFYVNGDINAVWNPEIEILKNKLTGVKEDNVLPILREDKGIISASINIFPFWKKYIPNDLSKIKIIID